MHCLIVLLLLNLAQSEFHSATISNDGLFLMDKSYLIPLFLTLLPAYMKNQLLRFLVVGALLLGFGTTQAQNNGGPDLFGYTWRNSNSVGGPTYNWIEISTTGTEITGLADDNFVGPFAMPNFTYYWNTFNTFTVGSNGYIRLGDNGLLIASGATGFVDWPTVSQGTNVLSPLLSDLTFVTQPSGAAAPNAKAFYEVQGSKLIVQWEQVPQWNLNTANQISGANTFEVILDAADSSFVYQYKQISGTVYTGYSQFNKGGNSGPLSGLGLNVTRNVRNASNLAIKYTYPRASTYRYVDASVNWIHNPENLAIAGYKGQPINITANIRNTGTVAHANRIRVFLNLLDPQSNIVLQDTINFPAPLAKGKDTTVTFPKPFPASLTPGVYLAQVTMRLNGDQLLVNNEELSKITIVDSVANGEIKVGFDYNDPNVLLNLGSTGGTSFDLPFYPAKIVGVEFVSTWPEAAWFNPTISVPDSLAPFNVALYSGPNLPTAASLLTSLVVDKPSTDVSISQEADTLGTEVTQGSVSGYYVAIKRTLATPIDIISGRVYMGITQNRRTRFLWNGLVYDSLVPTSGRAFEITAGVWAPSRNRAEIEVPFRLILKSQGTVTSGPRVEQYVAIGNLYPNPAQGRALLPINLRTAGDVSIRLIASNGAVVREEAMGYQAAGKNEVAINLSTLRAGLYICQVNTPDGVYTKRLVVK
jgi:hypothetical protein